MPNNQRKTRVEDLVDKYKTEVSTGRIQQYTEEDIKKGFILPLFDVLGWNTTDRGEVSSEEQIKSSGRVDYGFYLNGHPKFYVEAKRPTANIHNEQWARQAVRYSWNKGVTWAILTNFERLLVFNAQDISSSLANKLLFDISFTEYTSEFDRLWLISKFSFETNALDVYAEKIGKKFQKIPITALLYKDLDECRGILTKALSIWNSKTKGDLLDEGVQKLLDRLIFIRVAEDREIEPPTLLPMLRAWESSKKRNEVPFYQFIVGKFRELDDIYDSNLFLKHPLEDWEEYSGATEKTIKILYGKTGYYEYDFKVMPADVLGAVYENYLGHRLSQAVPKGKPLKEVDISRDARKRKEQGIYYTPTFIVNFIVENALKPVLDKCKSVEQLRMVKVVDPACGSGSFLIKALDLLNEKYKEFGQAGDESTKLEILTNNIYGVDLDEQAVEIARLNLLINSLNRKMKLPLLKNIKCGNSLISGSETDLKKYFGTHYQDKKAFNWESEFPEVFEQGGFDVVIGNPPYVSAVQDSKGDVAVRDFYRNTYSLRGAFDIYIAFLLKGIQISNKRGSYGWIVPNKLMAAEYASDTKNLLKENGLHTVIDVSKLKVFGSVGVYPIIILGDKTRNDFQEFECESIEDLQTGKLISLAHSSLYKTFKDLGIKLASGATGFQAQSLTRHIGENRDKGAIPFVVSGSVDPYQVHLENVRYMGHNYKYAYIKKGGGIAQTKWNFWINSKIVISGMTKRIEACYFERPLALGVGVYAILDFGGFDPYFLLAVLNSKFLTYYFRKEFKHKHLAGGYLAINKSTLEQLPIVKPDVQTESRLSNLAQQRSSLTDRFYGSVDNSNKWARLKSEIEKIDHKIDEVVYKLYNLSDAEIKIVESSKVE